MRDCDRHNRGLTSVPFQPQLDCQFQRAFNMRVVFCLLKGNYGVFFYLTGFTKNLSKSYYIYSKDKKAKNEILCFIERTRSVLVFIYLFLQLKGEF